MTNRVNDIVTIFNAFKSNEDFFMKILKEALIIGKEDEARKIVRARDELKNGYDISNDTVELIKNNIDKYLNIINKINEKKNSKSNRDVNVFTASNATYSSGFDAEKKLDGDTFILSDPNVIKNSTREPRKNSNIFTAPNNTYSSGFDAEKKLDGDTFILSDPNVIKNSSHEPRKKPNVNNNNLSDSTKNVNKENNYDIINNKVIDNVDVLYSSNIAKKNLERELAQVNNQIIAIRSNINNSEKMPSKKLYQQLFQLESYRDKIQSKLDSINLEESYADNARIANNDNRLSNINEKINDTKQKLNSNKPKFVKAILSNKMKKLLQKQGKIQEKQRTIVNRDLLKYYKTSFKDSKSDSKNDAIDKYYQDKKELLQEKRDVILDNVDEYSNNIFNNAKNKFYKYKSMPTELRIKHIENLQNHNGLKDKVGRLVGFNHVKEEIANKLYPKVQNTRRQTIDKLKELRGNLKMEEMYNNLIPDQPALESSVRQR